MQLLWGLGDRGEDGIATAGGPLEGVKVQEIIKGNCTDCWFCAGKTTSQWDEEGIHAGEGARV